MKRPVIPIILAIVLAIGAGAAVYFYARSAENRALEAEAATPALVSAAVIPAGTSLAQAQADGLITPTQVSQRLRPADAIASVNAGNSSLVALGDVPAGQILLSTGFGEAPRQVAALPVPDGLMAVTLQLEDPDKVGAFLRPGSEVAVFDTIGRPALEPGQIVTYETRPLLSRVLVLAVGSTGEAQESAAPSEEWAARLVTLAVDQPQAERLVHASHTGALTLALLSDSTTLTPSIGVTDETLFTESGSSKNGGAS